MAALLPGRWSPGVGAFPQLHFLGVEPLTASLMPFGLMSWMKDFQIFNFFLCVLASKDFAAATAFESQDEERRKANVGRWGESPVGKGRSGEAAHPRLSLNGALRWKQGWLTQENKETCRVWLPLAVVRRNDHVPTNLPAPYPLQPVCFPLAPRKAFLVPFNLQECQYQAPDQWRDLPNANALLLFGLISNSCLSPNVSFQGLS